MVHDERLLEAAHLFERVENHAGVADHGVERNIERADRVACRDDRIEIRKIQDDRCGPAFDRRACGLAGGTRTRGADHVRAAQGQHAHGFPADAGVAAGDDDGATAQVETCGGLLGGRARIEIPRAGEAGQGGRECGQRAGLQQAAPADVEGHGATRPCGKPAVECRRPVDRVATGNAAAP
ncbi:hypothetical protein [Luteimonas sp. 100069]|uniref:hypothetical protein n=1 Tax=Luteimonas sp. 100069 TaxID=2006109 RepID=UPI001F3E4F7B|nr:hypothetical protein [Luteimonas sp. 100069]